ncbi:hypothetical protein [Streptomyces sp. NPDC046976]|uniref:hypothetical protein n=1 Tax=Streptomyces sp. NPDC046976 TaxID=3155258 RepID=UPI0033DB2B29
MLAFGSNACPGQLRGVSAHVSRMGYVSASPVKSPSVTRELFLLWPDRRQLDVIDASEGAPLPDGTFRRAWLPAPDVQVQLADATVLSGAYAYVNRHGVLHDGTGAPRRHPGRRPLLTELLAASRQLRELFGARPEEFSERARGDARLCARGTRLFAERAWVTGSGLGPYLAP